jgi:hypothetical protein
LTYKPTKVDIDWLKNALSLLRDGGGLGYPRSGLVYTVDHTRKTLTLTFPRLEQAQDNFGSWLDHEATIEVAKVLGYKVLPEK